MNGQSVIFAGNNHGGANVLYVAVTSENLVLRVQLE
jgi:hypothetical protein